MTETSTEDGETKTRQVQRTQRNSVSGTVSRDFDDILIIASRHVTRKRLAELEPRHASKATPRQPSYLTGHHSLRYDTESEAGLGDAKEDMAGEIVRDARRDIGGNEQSIHTVDSQYFDVDYKLLLLPVWIPTCVYQGKPWQILINGETGEVQGDRPFSAWKIALTTTGAVAVIGAIATLIVLNQQ